MTARRYAIGLLATLAAILAVVGAINAIVDPFRYFGLVDKPGFNREKPAFHGHERLVKPAIVARLQPQAVIAGSSFAEIGLPPTHRGFTDDGRLRAYNMAIAGAEWPAVYCYARFLLAQPGLKRLVVGVSGTAEAPCDAYRNVDRVDHARLLFSRQALNASLKTLRKQGEPPLVTPEGLWYFHRYADDIRNDDDVMAKFATHLRSAVCEQALAAGPTPPLRLDRSPPPRDASTAGLRQLIALAQARGVELYLIVYPQHVIEYELERRCGLRDARWSNLWRLASIVEEAAGADSPRVSLWDFHAYTRLNGERIRSGTPMRDRLWQDSGHFNHEVGSVVFDTLFRGGRDYGRRLRTADFERLVAEAEAAREAFLRDNAGWIDAEIAELVGAVAKLRGQPAPAMPEL